MWRNTGVVVVCATLVLFGRAYAAETMQCPDGKPAHLATPEEAASAPGKGIIAGVTNMCGSDAQLGITNDVGAAKQYLLSIAQGLPGTQAPPTKDRIEKLDNALAVCAANFFKSYTEKTGVKLILRSAYRDGPNGENARAGGASGSNHTKGLAIDVNPADGNYPRLWQYASKDPRYGVCFPYLGGDRPHLTLAGTNTGEAGKCARQGVTKACDGAKFTPKDAGPARPTSPVADALRDIINPPRPPASSEYFCVTSRDPVIVIPLNTPPGPECLNYQGRMQQQPATQAQQGTPGIQNPTQQGTPNQQGSPPLQGSMPADYKTGPLAGATTTTTSSTTNPTLEQLLLNIGQGSTTSSGTSTVVIVSSGSLHTLGSEAVTIAPSVPPSQPEAIPTTITPITDGGTPAAPQTFAPSSTYTVRSERVGFSETLADIQSALQRILAFLQPFRGRTFNGIENAE